MSEPEQSSKSDSTPSGGKPPGAHTWMAFIKDLKKAESEDDQSDKEQLLEIIKQDKMEAAIERKRWQFIALVIILGGLAAAGVTSAVKWGELEMNFSEAPAE